MNSLTFSLRILLFSLLLVIFARATGLLYKACANGDLEQVKRLRHQFPYLDPKKKFGAENLSCIEVAFKNNHIAILEHFNVNSPSKGNQVEVNAAIGLQKRPLKVPINIKQSPSFLNQHAGRSSIQHRPTAIGKTRPEFRGVETFEDFAHLQEDRNTAVDISSSLATKQEVSLEVPNVAEKASLIELAILSKDSSQSVGVKGSPAQEEETSESSDTVDGPKVGETDSLRSQDIPVTSSSQMTLSQNYVGNIAIDGQVLQSEIDKSPSEAVGSNYAPVIPEIDPKDRLAGELKDLCLEGNVQEVKAFFYQQSIFQCWNNF